MLVKTAKEQRLREVEKLIHEYYGIAGELQALQGEVDENYWVKSDQGNYVFKITGGDIDEGAIAFQCDILRHLEAETSLLLPQLVTSKHGHDFEVIEEEGKREVLRMLTWVDGRLYAQVNPHSQELFYSLGQKCGQLSHALVGFDNEAANRESKWDPAQGAWVNDHLDIFGTKDEVRVVNHFYELYQSKSHLFKHLRKGVNHNDANDYNIIVNEDLKSPEVAGFIDFGDAIYTYTINELAMTLAYAMMDKNDPIEAGCAVVRGYHEVFPLDETEVEVLLSLLCMRLLISVTHSALNKIENPDNEYLLISEKPAWDLLNKLADLSPDLVHYKFRKACGWVACPNAARFRGMAQTNQLRFADVVEGLSIEKLHWLDISVGSKELGNATNSLDPKKFCRQVDSVMEDEGVKLAIGGYNEVRPIYTTDAYLVHGNNGPKWRTVHLGVDVFADAGTPVYAALDGKVHSFANNDASRDYGPTIILEHEIDGVIFYTLYGHLSIPSLDGLHKGKEFKKGELIAWFGDVSVNGEWPPHLHFQLISDMLDYDGDYPGVVFADELEVWKDLILDPLSYMGLEPPQSTGKHKEEIKQMRSQLLGPNLSLSYDKPLHIVRGFMQYLYDHTGRRYLDMVNNVAHVGHEHPRVVKAGQQQMAVLNTNTRYLHEELVLLAEELVATLPDKLSVCYFVNSGSEANELALRMVKVHTHSEHKIVLKTGYHGNSNGCIGISSYKFDGKGGSGAPPNTYVMPTPDLFRGVYQDYDPEEACNRYVGHVSKCIADIHNQGEKVGGFFAESILSCAGQVPLPEGYLQKVYKLVRDAGGLCVADEVQTGIGRVGSKFWAFELQDVVPDIVTIGKPLGNGHPVAAVVTTPEVAASFNNGMEYFNTFGGNPVSCAIAREVLAVVKEEGLRENANSKGRTIKEGLIKLKDKFSIIGDVRGEGLFLGFELVKDGKEPAAHEATYLVNRMREKGILLSTDGPDNNVIKIKPPMCIDDKNVRFFLQHLEETMKEDLLN